MTKYTWCVVALHGLSANVGWTCGQRAMAWEGSPISMDISAGKTHRLASVQTRARNRETFIYARPNFYGSVLPFFRNLLTGPSRASMEVIA